MPPTLVVLIAVLLVLGTLSWILSLEKLVELVVLGRGLCSSGRARGRGQLEVQRPERPAPGDPSRLGLAARCRSGSPQRCHSRFVDSLWRCGPSLVSFALADRVMLDLAAECQSPSPCRVTRWATDWRGGIETPRLEERIEEFNQTPLLEEPPQWRSRSSCSPELEESLRLQIFLHPNGGSQPLYLVKRQSRSLDTGEGHDGCR